jgi:molybdopterin synthase catalytic subunit
LIEITTSDFDANSVISTLRSEKVGAIVSFIGTVRDFTEKSREGTLEKVDVKELVFETYDEMALEKMTLVQKEAKGKYGIEEMSIIHRKGKLKPSDQIVIIACSAAHRKDAFLACEYAIEELKKIVPIWKKEVGTNGEYWVGEKGKGMEEND